MKQILNITVLIFMILATSCAQSNSKNKQAAKTTRVFPLEKSAQEWKMILSPIAFEVMVNRATEPPFNNPYNDNHERGIYVSAASGEPLFSSDDKFESGSGWPSFTRPIKSDAVIVVTDTSYGMVRDEIIEAKTGLHLGHLFNDGPLNKGGKRYCMNSAALKFIKK